MKDWDPQLYRRFEAERTRPAEELLARVCLSDAAFISDLGCGPGNSTELLCNTWTQATVTGVDTSPAMLDQAKARLPQCRFTQADISGWQAPQPQNLIFANASLQWVADHHKLLPALVNQLPPAGVLAVQMPDNLDEPSHRLMREVAGLAEWRALISPAASERKRLLCAADYYDLLSASGCQVDLWHTTYYHLMPSPSAIIDWLKATGLRPFLVTLSGGQQVRFLDSYLTRLRVAYPARHDGSCLLAFPRLFIVAQRR
ncbi:trans-aconitate 2-methyltransferase [Erwinia sp. OLTSP20]|uniref:trans-aconitate 2-methyltransferase n=1 Tax=unclassified Erwinia TaxID=2622719 RepID=UPI000C187E88|nr:MULTISPECIES: trans-aconitate 2-methyltransferase [unclassified Erwinia]PIJ50502.1 trans-aconitate 2-methyltransferase [Erwinia sp. OAMSP11]PIJ72596.1 trans-aconitate 2-methyltransferase [Erwinia sp. OLSSP12]PIJ82076.1 trans-aconitate 2-methyltransferase [Erwinia sp. OLCASP19]PIJ84958.1 trans-aconitate 2-methyltransferase [Erwinia sp. OLMTSP26]PIJ86562.1 trans-aconitate 2-methyltransferase [Erwinia sp. OLMDSP33]